MKQSLCEYEFKATEATLLPTHEHKPECILPRLQIPEFRQMQTPSNLTTGATTASYKFLHTRVATVRN